MNALFDFILPNSYGHKILNYLVKVESATDAEIIENVWADKLRLRADFIGFMRTLISCKTVFRDGEYDSSRTQYFITVQGREIAKLLDETSLADEIKMRTSKLKNVITVIREAKARENQVLRDVFPNFVVNYEWYFFKVYYVLIQDDVDSDEYRETKKMVFEWVQRWLNSIPTKMLIHDYEKSTTKSGWLEIFEQYKALGFTFQDEKAIRDFIMLYKLKN